MLLIEHQIENGGMSFFEQRKAQFYIEIHGISELAEI